MSKVKAYRCNYCGGIFEDKYMYGVSRQTDIFDKTKSYPLISDNDKADIHHCHECYKRNVLMAVDKYMNRKRDGEDAYKKRTVCYGVRL